MHGQHMLKERKGNPSAFIMFPQIKVWYQLNWKLSEMVLAQNKKIHHTVTF